MKPTRSSRAQSNENILLAPVKLPQKPQFMDSHGLMLAAIRKIRNCLPQHRQPGHAKEAQDPFRGRTQHRSEEREVSFLDLGGGNRQDLMHRVPEDRVGKRVFAVRLPEVPQGERGEAGSESGHAVDVALFGDEGAVLPVAPPADGAAALGGLFVAVESPEGGADDAVFGPEDVGHGVAPVEEGFGGEDLGGDDADWFCVAGVEGGFGEEGRDDAFGEDVEAVD